MKVTTELYFNKFDNDNAISTLAVDCVENKTLGIRINFYNEFVKSSFVLNVDECQKLINNLTNSLSSYDNVMEELSKV